MKKFFEGLKDILYDGIDYIMMIFVVAIVALIINWRLGGLFAENAIDTPPKKPIQTVDNKTTNEKNKDKPVDDENKENIENNIENKEQDENKKDKIKDNESSLVKINIPPGSLPSKIGSILVSNGLVEDKNEFVQKAIELKLETKLKYGEFEIPKDSSIEEILKILTK
jgi:hypothetical protein